MINRWLKTRQTLAEVAHERTRQERKWGPQRHTPERWITILGEEYGEAASAALHQIFDNQGDVTVGSGDLRTELIQVAAVAIAAIEDIDAIERDNLLKTLNEESQRRLFEEANTELKQPEPYFYSLGLSWSEP